MKRTFFLAFLAVAISCKEQPKKEAETAVVEEAMEQEVIQENAEWMPLFNGENFDGWHVYNGGEVPSVWQVVDGAMVFTPEGEGHGSGANLVTDNEYTSFVLSMEWKISEGGNSGFFWGVKEIEGVNEAYMSGPEIQVLDNEKHPDAKAGTTHQAGALYDMVSPSADVTKPVGEWNTCVLTIDQENNQGSVVLNGTEVAAFSVNGEAWDAMVAESKFNGWEHFGKYTTGKIGLQDHGNMVAFRNIKIKEIK